MISIKWMGVFVLCQTAFCIEKPYRLVEDTTCLEMDDKDRLSCAKSEEYHCLLDENYIKEYEVCREWKWIPKGKCAYFNTYNRGNVDERDCKPTPEFTCAPVQHRSTESKKYAACYVKKEITTQINQISTSTRPVTSDGGNSISFNSTGSTDKIGQSAGKMAAAIVFGVLIPLLIVVFFILGFKHLKCLEEFRKKDIELGNGENANEESPPSTRPQENAQNHENLSASQTNISETDPLLRNENENSAGSQQSEEFGKKDIELGNGENENLEESPPSTRPQENAQNHEKLTGTQTDSSETNPLLCNENENNAGNQQSEVRTENSSTEYEGEEVKSSEAPSAQDHTRNREGDFETEAEANSAGAIVTGRGSPKVIFATDEAGDTEVSYESDNSGSVNGKEELPGKEEQSISDEGPTGRKKIMTGNKGNMKSAGDEGSTSEKEGSTDEKNENGKLAGGKHGQTGEIQELTDEETTGEKKRSTDEKIGEPEPSSFEEDEPTDVFDDTAQSLQKESVDKADTEFCLQLFDFLNWVCINPARKVLLSVLSKNVEKSLYDILKDASVQTELKEILPPEYHSSISSMAEGKDSDSVVISYVLMRKFLKEKDTPNSGWGKPVKNTDTGIGDDVERLYRVYSILRETSNPVKIPVEGYERLLKVVYDVFYRLDADGEFKDDHEKLSKKLQDIKNFLRFEKTLMDFTVM